ncbi:hypothetical protein CDD80_2815 [Ophiocordyceps camponoti-rufipedis]|uniref:Uncharacterized protein n=1 Tax=Ophiocordyceps camponoti-rufipedis TaxID=2004952 RepID=A0A2C5Y9U8_9HYPO|nr:hypothetical protein CDD80_2815 [Ophiocordyceps camponoti-rufipedis]
MKFTTVAVCLASTVIAAPTPMSQEQAAINAGIIPDLLNMGITLDRKLNKPLKEIVGASGLLHELLNPVLDVMLGPSVDEKFGIYHSAHAHEGHHEEEDEELHARDVQSAASYQAAAKKGKKGGLKLDEVLVQPVQQVVGTDGLLGKLLNPLVKLLLGDTIGLATKTLGSVTGALTKVLPLNSIPIVKDLPIVKDIPKIINNLPIIGGGDDEEEGDDE